MADPLEDILDRATDPQNTENNEALSSAFCDQVNREFDGPHHAIKLIIQKLHLHQETITLQSLTVVEQCVKNCGKSFHTEVGKYRFLNELIKLLSPKYDASITPQVVKDRVIQLLFSWYCGLPHESKIGEAYKMLKQQGVITRDPVDQDKSIPTYSEQARNTVFQDDEKSELLSALLKSTNPDDLQAANKLIKTMVKQEDERLEKVSQRVQELETVSNNVKLLTDMLDLYSPSTSSNDKDVMKDLYESCVNMRPQLFRLASLSADEKDDCITEILQASDSLTKVIDEYQLKVLGERKSLMQGSASAAAQANVEQAQAVEYSTPSLLDLGLDADSTATNALPTEQGASNSLSSSILNDQLELLGLNEPSQPTSSSSQMGMTSSGGNNMYDNQAPFTSTASWPSGFVNTTNSQYSPYQQPVQQQRPIFPGAFNQPGLPSHCMPVTVPTASMTKPSVPHAAPRPTTASPTPGPFDQLSLLDFPSKPTMTALSSTASIPVAAIPHIAPPAKNPAGKPDAEAMNASLAVGSLLDIDDPFAIPSPPSSGNGTAQSQPQEAGIAQLALSAAAAPSSDAYSVPLECIQPLNSPPINILDQNGIKTVLHFAKDNRETANPLVLVALLSTMSTNVTGVKNFTIQAAVPKNMRLKLQPPSSSELAAFSPLLPLPSLTQVMLVANPAQDRVRVKFRISGQCGGEQFAETKDIDDLKSS